MTGSDEQRGAGVRRGDAASFEALMERYGDAVRRHLASLVRDGAAAEDLTQEVFLRLWTRGAVGVPRNSWPGGGRYAERVPVQASGYQ